MRIYHELGGFDLDCHTGDHYLPRPVVLLRLSPSASHTFLYRVPCGLPPKLHSQLAIGFLDISHIYGLLRNGHHRSFSLVFPLRSRDTRREAQGSLVI